MKFIAFLQICLLMALPAAAQTRPQPEIATGVQGSTLATGKDFMIVTANPHASAAGYEILKRDGSAADAAITAQLVLGLTEPQSSGLGGGAFVLHYDAASKKLTSYDARETAPYLSGPFLFHENGKPMKFWDAVVGGRAVGVPGVPMLLSDLHESHGKLTWMELFDDAIKLAEEGFEISPRLTTMIDNSRDRLQRDPDTADYFLSGAKTLKNPAYAETLKELQFHGISKFYHGKIAGNIVDKVQNFAANPGLLSRHDFQSYSVKARDPVCAPYRAHIVCSMGEPSSGGLTVLQILGMLEHFDIAENTAQSWHIIAQASALAFADRNAYIADPDFAKTPGIAMIDPQYLKSRAALINPDGSPAAINPGAISERPGTTHISIIDKVGNIVSMTSSIEGAFGSHLMTDGFLLNNQLTDFAFDPRDEDGNEIANAPAPGKRPRSSMSPTIVFDQTGEPVLVIGSAGGSRIIGYVLQCIIAMIDWNQPIQDSIAAPHILSRGKVIEMERSPPTPSSRRRPESSDVKGDLEAYSNKVEIKDLNSGLTAIHIKNNQYHAAPDPRREGVALGE